MDKRLEEIPEWTIAENFLQNQANISGETKEPVEEVSDTEPSQPEEPLQEADSPQSATVPLQEDMPLPDASEEAAAASEFTPLQENGGNDLFENLTPSSGLDNGSEDLFSGFTDDANTIRAVGEDLDPEEAEEDENKLNDLLNRLDISENIRRMSESAQEDIADVIERKEEQLELSSAIPTEEMEIEDMNSVDLDAFSPMDADMGGNTVDALVAGENMVSGLDAMEELDPEENMISGLDSMEELDPEENMISGLDAMEELDSEENMISGLDDIEELDTGNNMLTDMSGLDDLTSLDDLEDKEPVMPDETVIAEELVIPDEAAIAEELVMPDDTVIPEEQVMPDEVLAEPGKPESKSEEPAEEVVPEPKQSKIITLSEIMEQTKATDLSQVKEPSSAIREPEVPAMAEPELPPLPPVVPQGIPPVPPVAPQGIASVPPVPSYVKPDFYMKPERRPLEDDYSAISEYDKVPTINDLERKWRKIQETEDNYEPQKVYEPENSYQSEETHEPENGYKPEKTYEPENGYKPEETHEPENGYKPGKTYEPVKEESRPRESANGFAYSLEDVLGVNTTTASAVKHTGIPVEESAPSAEPAASVSAWAAEPVMPDRPYSYTEPASYAEEESRAERTSYTGYSVVEEPEPPKLPKPKSDSPRPVAATVVEESERRVYHVHSEEIVKKTGAGKRSYYKIIL